MNPYQRRLGLVLGATALFVLLLSSTAQSTIGYAQFASAYSEVAKTCPNFPNPVSILLGDSIIQSLGDRNKTATDYQFRTYVKHFSLSGFWINSTSIGFAHLQVTVFSTQTWFFYNTTKKSSQTNSTLNATIESFAAKVLQHEAIVTAKHGEGNYTAVSLDAWSPFMVKLSGDNLKGTISCGAT